MITTISHDGTLVIKPETHLEAYALRTWCNENFTESWYHANDGKGMKIIVYSGTDHIAELDPKGVIPLARIKS